MLAKRVIPCLDVLNGLVVKGVQFKNHKIVGDIIELASRYAQEGADELVFYDIGASVNDKLVSRDWISQVSQSIDIPFCVAGGINSVKSAEERLAAGADKISINSPAIQRPGLINELTDSFGKQCVVIGIDTFQEGNKYRVKSFTGDPNKTKETGKIFGAYPITDSIHIFGGIDRTTSTGITNTETTGVAYESCCWAFRLAHFKDHKSGGSYNYSTGMELVLTGIGSTSSPFKSKIENNIPGYEANLR